MNPRTAGTRPRPLPPSVRATHLAGDRVTSGLSSSRGPPPDSSDHRLRPPVSPPADGRIIPLDSGRIGDRRRSLPIGAYRPPDFREAPLRKMPDIADTLRPS